MVAAARRLFAERGYESTSMNDVARATGISKPMLYAYFGSKEGLYAACIKEAGIELRASVRAAAASADDGDPELSLWRGLMAVFTGIEQRREAWNLLYPLESESPAGPLGARAAYGMAAMTELVEELMVAAARKRGLPELLVAEVAPQARALTAAVMALTDWWRRHPEEPKELQATRVMNLAWRGFEGVLAAGPWLPPELRPAPG
jgi:AcrR family transcriptional regulator